MTRPFARGPTASDAQSPCPWPDSVRCPGPVPVARQRQMPRPFARGPTASVPLTVSPLDRCRIKRQRRDDVDDGDDLACGVPSIEGLHVALADVAAIQAVQAVARREGRDLRAIPVEA